jgi:hypothetical protein
MLVYAITPQAPLVSPKSRWWSSCAAMSVLHLELAWSLVFDMLCRSTSSLYTIIVGRNLIIAYSI